MRLAVWSGPRNISTALMRSFGNRADTVVSDEPFYACYLSRTGLEHPGRDEVIASQPTDPRIVIDQLLGPIPGGSPVWYSKHMAHHLLPDIDRSFIDDLTNVFLIRDPAAMLASLDKRTPNPTLADTGLPQQVELFARLGRTAPVIDAKDVLEDPRRMLSALCDAIGLSFDDAMLAWPPGPRPTDGVWAKYWYDAVETSTGFGPYVEPGEVPEHLVALHRSCLPLYEELRAARLTI